MGSFWYFCLNGLYCGVTLDIERREREHNDPQKQAWAVRMLGIPAKMVYWESYPTRSAACKREWAIKQLSRKDKLELIETKKPAG